MVDGECEVNVLEPTLVSDLNEPFTDARNSFSKLEEFLALPEYEDPRQIDTTLPVGTVEAPRS